MSNDTNTATEDTNAPVNGADGAGGATTPESKKGTKAGNAGVYVHKFRKTYEFEGKKYDTLNFYFENLTGRDMVTIESEMQANNEYALDPLLSRNFQGKMSARAANIGNDVLESMPIQEFNAITNAARNFLIDSGY